MKRQMIWGLVGGIALLGFVVPGDAGAQDVRQVAGYMQRGDFSQMLDRKLSALHDSLNLAPGQEEAWQAFAASAKERMAHRQSQRPNRETWASLSAPERLQLMSDRMTDRAADLKAAAAALQTLYGALTPEQQQIMNQHFQRHGRRHHGPARG